MPSLLRNGQIEQDSWLPPTEALAPGHLATVSQYVEASEKPTAVQIEPGEGIADVLESLDSLELVAVNFPAFMDGRGFSYARELRERGYTGELRAVGAFIRDQLHYLSRCGFNAFQMDDESALEAAKASLNDFSEHYQAAIDKPQPLFKRRAG